MKMNLNTVIFTSLSLFVQSVIFGCFLTFLKSFEIQDGVSKMAAVRHYEVIVTFPTSSSHLYQKIDFRTHYIPSCHGGYGWGRGRAESAPIV